MQFDDGRLQTLLDKQEIGEVLTRYCRGADRCDFDLMKSCYHEDATDDHGMIRGGVGDLIAYAEEGLPTMTCTQHFITNVTIELEGDTAVSDAYCLAFHRMPCGQDGSADHLVGLRFLDRMERRGGAWKIARRTTVYEWSRVDPVDREWTMEGFVRGARSAADISYGMLAEIRSPEAP